MKYLLLNLQLLWALCAYSQYQWQIQNSGTTASLRSVYFANENTGWAVGSGGTILSTANGGQVWTVQNSGTTSDLYSVWFFDANKGFALGASAFLKTTNGGLIWTSVTAPFTGGAAMWFTSQQVGYVKTSSDVYKTTDGGASWTLSAAGIYTMLGNIHFSDAQNGWMVCPGYYTSDGGSTWQSGSIPAMCDAMRWVWFTSPTTGYVVDGSVDGTDGGGKFWKTTTGGMSWTQLQTGLFQYLNCVRFVDASRGWVCGRNGNIAATSDAGSTWVAYNTITSNDLNHIFFLDANTGWFAGENGTIISCRAQPEICLITVDGASQKNTIYWDAQAGAGIASWNIYRETTAGNYSLIGNLPYTSGPVYTDVSSQPSVQSYRYKLTFLDANSNESARSPYHQTMNLSVTQGVPSTTMTLMWSRYEDESGEYVPDYYYIFRGTSPSSMQLHDSVSGAFNMYNDMNVTGISYYRIEIVKNCSGVLRGGSNNDNNDFNGISSAVGIKLPLVFPNPVKNYATLVPPFGEEETYGLYLTDLTGSTVKFLGFEKGTVQKDMSGIHSGVWIVELRGRFNYRMLLVKE